ncbi:MAG TPA: hypothetical protein VE224_02420, partial [Pseudolabrys sp.]|nr:hypothetical protein [Pseudolabrys sp.]
MTGRSERPNGMHERARARRRACGLGVSGLFAMAILLLALAGLAAGSARADDMIPGKVTATTDHGFTRLVFKFDQPVPARVSMTWPIMIVHFSKPVNVSVDRINEGAPAYISAARRDPDGSAVRIALVQKVKYHVIPAGERLFIDLLPESWTGLLPGLPQDVIDELAKRASQADELIDKARLAQRKALENPIRVRVASQPTFTRYVFDLPIETQVDPGRSGGTYTLHFDKPIKWDVADALAAMPKQVQSIDAVRDENTAAVHFKLNGDPPVRTFRDGKSFVVDIGSGGPSAQQAIAAGAAKLAATEPGAPSIAAPETEADQKAPGAEAAQGGNPAVTVQAPSDSGGAPMMVDMPAPGAPPGAKPAPPPSPEIVVSKPTRHTAKPPAGHATEMAKASSAPISKPSMAEPAMAKPKPTKRAIANTPVAPPPAGRAHDAQMKTRKPLEPIAPPRKAQPRPAPQEAMAKAEQTPRPNPKGPVVAGLHRDGERLEI